jgi:hypothetical protein
MELANVLQRRCSTMEQVQKVLDRWLETEENVPKPSQLGSLCSELSAGAAILPEGCDECGRDGLWRDVQRLDQDGQIVYCLARCTCARGRQLAALDSQRAIEAAAQNRNNCRAAHARIWRKPQPQDTNTDLWTDTDYEIALVMWSMNRFERSDPSYQRMYKLLDECSLSGALREGFPPGTEDLETAWNELVVECRMQCQ